MNLFSTIGRRSWLFGLVFTAIASVSIAATIHHWWYTLPPPAEASREDIFRWMVLRDLENETQETRDVLLSRLCVELDTGIDFSDVDEQLTAADRKLFLANTDLLLRCWFVQLADEYNNLQPKLRNEFIDNTIARIQKWDILDYLSSQQQEPTGVAKPWNVMSDLNHRAERWIESANKKEQSQLRKFLSAVHFRIMLAAFRNARD